ncbi:EG45-like domain containing protein [Rhododendron vialii]|uniref:EG45-like domain containing protein n=1 Tax=Rhododendron vialii TaxID=182163 RepID=UPI00265E2C76|nr:EG45-like domain containing protein [Rhododendron vialii]
MGGKMLISIMVVISIYLVPMTYAQDMYETGTASFRPAPFFDMSCPQYRISDLTDTKVTIAGYPVWQGPETCGRNYSICCTGSAIAGAPNPCTSECVVVMVVEHCLFIFPTICKPLSPLLESTTFQLSQQAFSIISTSDNNPNSVITIKYKSV